MGFDAIQSAGIVIPYIDAENFLDPVSTPIIIICSLRFFVGK